MTDGKLHWKARDLTGQKFGMLTAQSVETNEGGKLRWRYSCDCGVQTVKLGQDVTKEVKRGGTPNCGCSTARLISAGNRRHGMTNHPAYAVYRSMIDRCRLPTHQAWKNYGGRGIVVCASWQESFENFWADMGAAYMRGLELDRKDNSKGYSSDNCRWTNRRVNAMNKRTSVKGMDIPELSRTTGIGRTTLYSRIKAGWPLDKLTEPPAFTNRYSTSSTADLVKDS